MNKTIFLALCRRNILAPFKSFFIKRAFKRSLLTFIKSEGKIFVISLGVVLTQQAINAILPKLKELPVFEKIKKKQSQI